LITFRRLYGVVLWYGINPFDHCLSIPPQSGYLQCFCYFLQWFSGNFSRKIVNVSSEGKKRACQSGLNTVKDLTALPHVSMRLMSLRGAKQRSNPDRTVSALDCFAPLAMTLLDMNFYPIELMLVKRIISPRHDTRESNNKRLQALGRTLYGQ
jgi:hypothetical protein